MAGYRPSDTQRCAKPERHDESALALIRLVSGAEGYKLAANLNARAPLSNMRRQWMDFSERRRASSSVRKRAPCSRLAFDQSCERQERDLRAFAKRAGHKIVAVIQGDGVRCRQCAPRAR